MKNFLYGWGISLAVILAIDFLWLTNMFSRFYKPYLGHIFTADFNYKVALIFYVLYAFGICYLVIFPSLALKPSIFQVLVKGFVLGLISYGAYDLTNQATIKDWPAIASVVDMLWGAVLTAATSAITYYILSWKLKAF